MCAINCEKEERGQILILSLYYFVSSSHNVLLDDVFRHPVQSIVVQHENPFSIALLLLLAAWHFALAAQAFRLLPREGRGSVRIQEKASN